MLGSLPPFVARAAIGLAEVWPGFGLFLNRLVINSSARAARNRPHPWSTVHPYVSWRSLTEMNWSARHLPPVPQTGLPDETRVQDLFRIKDKQRLSTKSTCLFPAFAQYLTDGFIRTRMPHSHEPPSLRRQNTSNHQIDLSPLYGRTHEQTLALRLLSNDPGSRGRLKSQRISGEEFPPFLCDKEGNILAEFACLDVPLGFDNLKDERSKLRTWILACGGDRVNSVPSVAAMNTLFLREHNRIAELTEKSNPGWDDDHVFEVSRNTVIVLFIKIVIEEYISHIAPLPLRVKAVPSVAWTAEWNRPNWITTEFSLLYRWHSLVPETMKWGNAVFPVAATFMNNEPLLSGGLGQALSDLSAQPSAALGAMNTATALLPFELAAIKQARICELARFNSYRSYIKSERYTSFDALTRNTDVSQLLSGLYKDADAVEFYPGLFCEGVQGDGPLPPTLQSMVALDAFTQALTNPLLSRHVYRPETFGSDGWGILQEGASLADIAKRNGAGGQGSFIGMTQQKWRYVW